MVTGTRTLSAALFVTTAVLLGSLAPGALAGEIAPPSASRFAALLVLATTADRKIVHADCVEPSRGHYMCSYVLRVPGAPATCHLIQARWTPARASIFTVTLAGRTRRCRSLSDALHSLR